MRVGRKHYKTVWMKGRYVYLIDQTLLPYTFKIRVCRDYRQTARYIKNMIVRGAGAIGVAAGFAMAQAVLELPKKLSATQFRKRVLKARAIIDGTRPTARNLFYATECVVEAALKYENDPARAQKASVKAAKAVAAEDDQAGRSIGRVGEKLIKNRARILTHCNAGWLAFSDWGTALAPIYTAKRRGKKVFVYVDETRPRSQGSRLTAWELGNENIPHAVIADTAAGCLMREGKVDLVIVGADRIAGNGDAANKIGTYSVAVLARENKIPFYVAAPLSTFDIHTKHGDHIPIERRSGEELFDKRWFRVMKKSRVENPAFDVTPAKYIRGIITEKGIVQPRRSAIKRLLKASRQLNSSV